MPYISKDNPCYFFTCVTHSRLPIFQTAQISRLLCSALDEARRSGEFDIYSYSVMPDHYHIVTDGNRRPSGILRYLNGIAARRIIDFLKGKGYESSLEKLRIEARGGHKYSVWQHHPNTFIITSERMLMQKVGYIHNNPVQAGLAENMEDYVFSSARFWMRKALLDDEPLIVDIKKLRWRE
ncbi:MAG: transposase [Acidobacteria bacterium]|nr:transposase [Acidobacteriota bacterium]